jgi:hypothetical protein
MINNYQRVNEALSAKEFESPAYFARSIGFLSTVVSLLLLGTVVHRQNV